MLPTPPLHGYPWENRPRPEKATSFPNPTFQRALAVITFWEMCVLLKFEIILSFSFAKGGKPSFKKKTRLFLPLLPVSGHRVTVVSPPLFLFWVSRASACRLVDTRVQSCWTAAWQPESAWKNRFSAFPFRFDTPYTRGKYIYPFWMGILGYIFTLFIEWLRFWVNNGK